MEQNPEEMLPRRTPPDPHGFHGRPNVNDEYVGVAEDPEDQKGKKPIEPSCSSSQKMPLSATETGQSSSASPIGPDSYCTICMEPKWQFECFHMKGCHHVFCSCCISQYVAVKIKENATWIRCPEPGCNDGILEPEMCRLILPRDLFDRWGRALCESLIGSMKFYCPYSDCSAMLIDESGGTSEVIKQSECPHCLRSFCAQCRVPWHEGMTCEGYLMLGADEREQEDLMLVNLARNRSWPEDQKGKKPIEPPFVRSKKRKFSVIETGHSSSGSPSAPNANCTICLESKWEFEWFHMKGCSHVFCSCCISKYVVVKIEENATWIRCPEPGCKDGILEPEMCRLILPPGLFDRWGRALCESLIGSMKFYCPYSDCSALLIDESGGTSEVIKQSECPHCLRLFCAQCRVPWHEGITCKGYQMLGADERVQEDLMLMSMARNSRWQRCPKCKYFVERIDGCNLMKCRCGICFCYDCGSEMTRLLYCRKCNR